jgi:hypothetical protein
MQDVRCVIQKKFHSLFLLSNKAQNAEVSDTTGDATKNCSWYQNKLTINPKKYH